MARDRDNDNNSRGPRKPPRKGAGRSGAGRPGAGRSGGGEGGRFRSERGSKSEGGKRFGERKSFGDRPSGDRKSFGDRKPSGDRKSFGEKKSFGERKSFGEKKSFGERKYFGERKSFGDKKPFAGKRDERPRGERSEHPRGERSHGDRPFRSKPHGEGRDFRKDRDGAPRGRGEGRDFKPRERSFNRDAGGERRFSRDDRPRGERSERPRFNRDRDDKPRFSRDRDGKPPLPGKREERGEGRSDRPRFERPRGERTERSRFNRDGDDKPRFSRDRDSKPGFSRDRKPPFKRDREERGEGRSDRPRFERPHGDSAPRGERPPRGERNDRPRGGWQDHPRSEGRADRGERPRGERTERPRFSRDRTERPERRDRDDGREEAPRREPPPASKDGDRIAKVVARAGMSSRREAEQWITDGRVAVNGRVITSPALDVVPSDVITIDGKKLPEREPTRLFLHHKPRGLVTTHSDPEGRATVFEQLPDGLPRVISVGRLDYNTEGLLLLTNDGALARALELPANGWLRRYRVRAHGDVTQEQLDALKDGIEIDGVRYGAIDATLDRDQGANVWITFEIREGKNREVRNVLAHLGLDVNRLIRTSYGPFQLGELAEGAVEEVDPSTLYEQLGDKVASVAKLDKNGRSETKPKQRRSGLIADRKGRRVLVERSANASRDDSEETGQSRPSGPHRRRYHGKRENEED